MKHVEAPTCEKDLKKFLDKVNLLRRFISNLSRKIDAFNPILRLKDETEFTWGAKQQETFEKIKQYFSSPPVLKTPRRGFLSGFIWLLKTRSLGCFDSKNRSQGVCHHLYKPTTY